jgi:manganese/iron transport system substrate-binding protein
VSRVSLRTIAALALTLAIAACSSSNQTVQRGSDGRIPVVTTISTFNSFVEAVGGKRVRVQSLVPVGASAETYQPTPQDVATLSQARLLVENGAGLESWLDRTLRNARSSDLRVLVETDGMPVKNNNPHLWMDPQLAKTYVLKIRDSLSAIDPEHAYEYKVNATRYNAKLDDLTKTIARRIGRIPKERRTMIVFHNAWQYYNDRFGITTLGFIEPNPGQEPNPQGIAQLIDLAKKHDVRAIYGEPEYSTKLVRQIAHNAGITVVENLYDDSIGTDPRVSTYIGMLTYDTNVIIKNLQ